VAAGEADRLLGVQEAAVRLGKSVALVRRFCGTDYLPADKIGKTWVIRVSDLDVFSSRDRPPGRPRRTRQV